MHVARIVLVACVLNSFSEAMADVTATARPSVHPVLLGELPSEVGRLTISVPGDQLAELRTVTLSMEGTEELADIRAVGFGVTKTRKSFVNVTSLVEAKPTSNVIELKMGHPLKGGENNFWVTCVLEPGARVGRRILVRPTRVETSLGSIDVKQDSASKGNRIGVALRRAGQDGVHTYRIPALATSSEGTLICVYDIRRRSSRDLQGDIDVGLSRSTDGGQTWEPMKVIMDMGTHGNLPQEQNGIGDPGILVDPATKRIFCFALWVHAKPGKHQWKGDGSEPGFEIGKTAQFMEVHSDDDGQTWSSPRNLTQMVKKEHWMLLAPSPQQGIALRDGTLVMPIQGRDEDGAFASLMLSDDHGDTWHLSERAHSGGNECQAAELGDGSIMLNIRNDDKKRRAVVVTKDKGKTWTAHATHERDLIEPTCNGSLYRWVSRSHPAFLLFCNPQSERERINMTIQISTDDGLTWPKERAVLLDEGKGFGYPSMSRVDDEYLGVVYEGSQSHLVFEKIGRGELGP